jgi:PLP dependent protein
VADAVSRDGELDVEHVRRNLEQVREELAAAAPGSPPRVLAAVKYVAVGDLTALIAAGIDLAGENRAMELERKAAAHPEIEWHFIGHLQSRKVRQVVPYVTLIHSLCSDSALNQLARHAPPRSKVLIEVNVAAEAGKSGIAPSQLDSFIERADGSGIEVVGLMTMPPLATSPEDSRRWFAALRELADARSLPELSMGTTQDFTVAAAEGATIVRIGSRLLV